VQGVEHDVAKLIDAQKIFARHVRQSVSAALGVQTMLPELAGQPLKEDPFGQILILGPEKDQHCVRLGVQYLGNWQEQRRR
jgi:hypothetical protein